LLVFKVKLIQNLNFCLTGKVTEPLNVTHRRGYYR
jgi:hypothetical protein